MAIYIKGIPMPKDGEHPIWISLHSDGTVEYNVNKGDGWQMTTAVSIPPHGRLIDADANLAVMMRVLDAPYTDHGTIDTAMLKACIKMFEEAPTIIPAEEAER